MRTYQVRDLKEKPGSDAAKLSNNEAKLTAARQRLQEATSKLYKGFGYYDAVGGTLCQPEVEMLKKAQQGFFGSAFSVVSFFLLFFDHPSVSARRTYFSVCRF